MIKVTDVVLDLIEADELALEAMRANLLNFSAYADKIHKQIENIAKKPVKKGTIIVALTRIAKNPTFTKTPLKPEVKLTDLSIRSSLSVISFDKTADIQRKIVVLHPFQVAPNDLFAISEGPTEITLVVADKTKERLLKEFRTKPKNDISNLTAITIQYPEKLAQTPNVLFTLISHLAAKRIQIVEIISTFTEASFIVKKEDMEETMKSLNFYFKQQSPSRPL